NASLTTEDRSEGVEAAVGWTRTPEPRDVDVVPAPVEAALRPLAPRAIEETDALRRLASLRLRWTPEPRALNGTSQHAETRSYRYASILERPEDADVRPVEAPREGLISSARITLRPIASLHAGATFASTRDLLPTDRAGARPEEREAIARARSELAGVDLGWERQRTLSTFVDYRPPVASWLRPNVGFTARYRADRLASRFETIDSAAVLQRAFDGDR